MNAWKSCVRWMTVGALAVVVGGLGMARPAQANVGSWVGYSFSLNFDEDHAGDAELRITSYNSGTAFYSAVLYRPGLAPTSITNVRITPGTGGQRYKMSFSEGSIFSTTTYTAAIREHVANPLYNNFVAGTMVNSGYYYNGVSFVHFANDPLPFCGNASILIK